MINFFLFIGSILFAWWCKKEIPQFAYRINKQVFDDYISLTPMQAVEFKEFFENSHLQPKDSQLSYFFYLLFPLIFMNVDNLLIAILLSILLFLSLLDYCYFLTDIRYILAIFTLSLLHIIQENISLEESVLSLLFSIIFFGLLIVFYNFIFKKESLGNGDIALFIAISPLFNIDKMLFVLFSACMLGIIFYFMFLLIKKRKIIKLPFIPFISLSTFLNLYVTI